MYPLILEYEDAISLDDLSYMINVSKGSTESDWSKMNEPDTNGEFWNNKRMLLDDCVLPSWHEKIVSLRSEIDFVEITEPRKVQRFNYLDSLGPLTDAEHVPSIRYGSILFLNEPQGAEIYFPKINYKVAAKTNKLVVYGGNQEYIIRGPEGAEPLYFSTVFMS
jgi:hypothetical protein